METYTHMYIFSISVKSKGPMLEGLSQGSWHQLPKLSHMAGLAKTVVRMETRERKTINQGDMLCPPHYSCLLFVS